MHYILFLLCFFNLFSGSIELGGKKLQIELANTHETRAKGLMGRTFLKEGNGMLFVYSHEQKLSFWMKNTKIPLSIAFFDKEQKLLEIIDMDVPEKEPPPIYSSKAPAMYALEVPKGWFEKEKIKVGAKFSFIVE
jgi:uncharacterized protein